MKEGIFMDRAVLKQDAKNMMKAVQPHPVLVTLAMFGAVIAAGLVGGLVSGLFSALGVIGSLLGTIVSLAVSVFGIIVVFGYYAYCLKVSRGISTGIPELFAYFQNFLKIIGLILWMDLFISLWSLLLVVPGIIAAIRYSQAIFIMLDNPDKGIRECVNESKAMMQGRWGEFFVLNLSFILWGLLVSVTFGIAGLYVMPYMVLTMAGYYNKIKQ